MFCKLKIVCFYLKIISCLLLACKFENIEEDIAKNVIKKLIVKLIKNRILDAYHKMHESHYPAFLASK